MKKPGRKPKFNILHRGKNRPRRPVQGPAAIGNIRQPDAELVQVQRDIKFTQDRLLDYGCFETQVAKALP